MQRLGIGLLGSIILYFVISALYYYASPVATYCVACFLGGLVGSEVAVRLLCKK